MADQGGSAPKQNLFTFEKLPQKFYPNWGFRERTPCFPTDINLIFMNGGMGDYICWMQSIRWLMSEANWLNCNLIVPKYFRELAEYWVKDYPGSGFADYTDTEKLPKLNTTPFRGPCDLNRESLNATGAHLSTCGWVYFTNKEGAPEGIDPWWEKRGLAPQGWDYYPPMAQKDLDAVALPTEASTLVEKRYAVITTGMTTNSRKVPLGAWNPIIEHCIARGLTPVFLGKAVVETGNPRNIHTTWQSDTRYDLGVDLRDKTTLMQAAAIMSRAAVVCGHDNGLLHLAGCTQVPIVFGYNLASPKHREPKRPVGATYNVILDDKELACNFCQSRTNFVIGYNFRECFYGDTKCMDMLFDNGGARWKKQIDAAIANG